MIKNKISTEVIHKVPNDITEMLNNSKKVMDIWNNLTPLARNEWICYVTIVKKSETRIEHVKRLQDDLIKGKKRPCCWPGCPHRNPNSKKYFSKK